ncbi:hypothetical protein [Methylobacterium sp. P5_C11]
MNEAHESNFRVLAAGTAIEREIGHQLGLEPSRSLTAAQQVAMQASAEAAVEAWQLAKRAQPDLEPRSELERRCAEFMALCDVETGSLAY